MGFFGTFWNWLNGQLTTYIGDNTAHIASALEPAGVSLATLYVVVWGYLHMTGRIEEPFVVGLKRILVLALVLGSALRLWLYNAVLVDTFYTAPAQLTAAIVGSADPIGTIDAIWDSGGAVAGALWNKGGVMSGDFGFYLAGAFVWSLMGLLCVYAMFLIALSHVALAVLLAVGPLFILMLLFDSTKKFFATWISQLANYALVTILTVLVAALLLQIVKSYALQTAALGAGVLTVDALHMVLVAALVLLVMRQVMPIASGLSGGISLSSFGAVSQSVGRGMRAARVNFGPLAAAGVRPAASAIGAAAVGGSRMARSAAIRLSAARSGERI